MLITKRSSRRTKQICVIWNIIMPLLTSNVMLRGVIVNYPRILKFTLLLFVLGVTMSTILAVGFIEAEVRTFINLNYALEFVISLFVYALLGFKQTEKPYMHSVLVALCLWFIAAPVDFSINSYYGIPFNPLIYLIPFILGVFGVSLGTMIGIRVRK